MVMLMETVMMEWLKKQYGPTPLQDMWDMPREIVKMNSLKKKNCLTLCIQKEKNLEKCFNLLENTDLGFFLHLNLDPKVLLNLFFDRSVTVRMQKAISFYEW